MQSLVSMDHLRWSSSAVLASDSCTNSAMDLMEHILIVSCLCPACCTCRHIAVGPCRYFPTLLIVLLAVFNDGAMIALSKDRVTPSRTPNTWNLTNIFITGRLRWPCSASRRLFHPIWLSHPGGVRVRARAQFPGTHTRRLAGMEGGRASMAIASILLPQSPAT